MKQALFFVCALAVLSTAFAGNMFISEGESIVGKNPKYDPVLANTLVYAAGLAYCKPALIKAGTCGFACTNMTASGFSYYYTYQATIDVSLSFSILINDNSKEVVYTFRGTDSTIQLVTEITKGRGAPYTTDHFNVENAEVLAYFQNVYKKNFQSLVLSKLNTLGKSSRSGYTYIFTGHSLGGALATLAALDASTFGYIPITAASPFLMTFGSPRVGNYWFATNVSNIIPELYRVVHDNDIVPHVPPCPGEIPTEECKAPKSYTDFGVNEGYWYGWHVIQEIYYNEDSSSWRACSQTNSEDPTCSDKTIIPSFSAHDVYLGIHLDTLCAK